MSHRAEIPGSVDLFHLHCRQPGRYPFLLQSVAGHPQSGRYDILFAWPREALAAGRGDDDFFAELSVRFARERMAASEPDLPFAGGWFLLLGYEAARWIEPRLRLPDSPFRLPDALSVRCTAAAIHDRERGTTHLFAEHDPAQLRELCRDVEYHINNELQDIDKKI